MLARRACAPMLLACIAALLASGNATDQLKLGCSLESTRDHLMPAFHIFDCRGATTDPNGPFIWRKKWHLFHQNASPSSARYFNETRRPFGKERWAHLVSDDNGVHWRRLPPALEPSEWYDQWGVFSGSTSFDPITGDPVIFYTGNVREYDDEQVQNIAFPEDVTDPDLLKWRKFEGNPVITGPFGRDPSTIWAAPAEGEHLIAFGSNAKDRLPKDKFPVENSGDIRLYRSQHNNITSWSNDEILYGPVAGLKGSFFECPDVFQIGNRGDTPLWTLKVSTMGTDLWIFGEMPNDTSFVPIDQDLNMQQRLDWGCFYASKRFYNEERDQHILFGSSHDEDSMSSVRARGWFSVLTLPRELSLSSNKAWLLSQPLRDLVRLRRQAATLSESLPLPISSSGPRDFQLHGLAPDQFELIVDWKFGRPLPSQSRAAHDAIDVGVRVLQRRQQHQEVRVGIRRDPQGGLTLYVDRSASSSRKDVNKSTYEAPLAYKRCGVDRVHSFRLHVFVDHSIVEVYADNGLAVISARVYPDQRISSKAPAATLFATTAPAGTELHQFTGYELSDIFENPADSEVIM